MRNAHSCVDFAIKPPQRIVRSTDEGLGYPMIQADIWVVRADLRCPMFQISGLYVLTHVTRQYVQYCFHFRAK